MKKSKSKPAADKAIEADKEVVRVTFRLHGPELQQVREVREMLSLNSELDAARYLMQRGLEAMSATLATRRSTARMADAVTSEKLVEQMMQKFGMKAEDLKKLG